ncbi:MAG: FHA domain-containing protein [Sciscionella sp.]
MSPPPATGDLAEVPAGTDLLVLRRGRQLAPGTRFVLDASVTSLGRHPDCDIVLSDVTVSRWHATIRREHGYATLVDGGSLNGTYLNGHPVDEADLGDGDDVWIGTYRFTFHAGNATP